MSILALTGVGLYQVMFAYSGFNKLHGYEKKVSTLIDKVRQRTTLDLPRRMANLGMTGVILLEVVGSLYLVLYAAYRAMAEQPPSIVWQYVARITIVLMVLFVVVVTYLYHYPDKRVIPFLSNLTTMAGFFLMWIALKL